MHEPNYFPEHAHAFVQVLVTFDSALAELSWTDGAGRVFHHSLGANHVSLIPAGFPHTVRWRRKAKVAVLFASPAWVEQVCGSRLAQGAVESLGDYLLADRMLGVLRLELADECESPRGNPTEVAALGECLAVRLLLAHTGVLRRRQVVTTSLLHPEVYARVVAFVDANLGTKLSVAVMAREARMSPSHFGALFQATTGLTPEQYLLRTRLWKAQELVRTGCHTIGQIAYATGFSDHSHLTVQFKRRFGVPPKAYLPAVRYV